MVPGVAGSIPVGHPAGSLQASVLDTALRRSVAQLVEHRSPKPAVGGSIPSGPVGQCWQDFDNLVQLASRRPRREEGGVNAMRSQIPARSRHGLPPWRQTMAVSSRGLGHGPLKAGTRVRIPLPLFGLARSSIGLGRHPFTVQRRVRLPYGLYAGRLEQWKAVVTRGAGAVEDRIRWRREAPREPRLCEGP